MRVFAIADLHLALGTPGKSMDRFGPAWFDHAERVARDWRSKVTEQDLVLLPGDFSWATKAKDVQPDLDYLNALPGTKVLCRGNHDYWWNSLKKVRDALAPQANAVQGDAVTVGSTAIAGTRLWDVPGLRFGSFIDWTPQPDSELQGDSASGPTEEEMAQNEKIYRRELGRLDRALADLDRVDPDRTLHRVVLVHYPPVSADLEPNDLTERFRRAGVHDVIFGHLHAIKREFQGNLFGSLDDVRYHLVSCDYVDAQLISVPPPESMA